MAKTLSVELEGIDKASKGLYNWLTGRTKLINQAAIETGYEVEATAKSLVRVDTGRLRASINTRFTKGGILGSRVIEVSVGTNVSYAATQEWGDPNRPSYGYTPYLFPAYEMHKNGFLESVRKILGK